MRLFFALLLIAVCENAGAQPASKASRYTQEISILSENDNYAFTYKDGYYTNGLFLQLSYIPRTADQYITRHRGLSGVQAYYELGQMIYNAETWRKQKPADIDRPYAGYLFLRKGYRLFYKNHSVMGVHLSIGTTGPASGAEPVQKFYHKLFHLPKINAWQYQLNGEPALNIQWSYHQNMLQVSQSNKFTQLHATLNINAGNVFTNAAGGVLIKAGHIQKPEASSFYHSATGNSEANGVKKKNNEFFVYFHPQLMTQVYNATIQGPMFSKNKGPITGTPVGLYYFHQFGVYYAQKHFVTALSITYKNREAEAMRIKERYGSLMLAYRFGKPQKK